MEIKIKKEDGAELTFKEILLIIVANICYFGFLFGMFWLLFKM